MGEIQIEAFCIVLFKQIVINNVLNFIQYNYYKLVADPIPATELEQNILFPV